MSEEDHVTVVWIDDDFADKTSDRWSLKQDMQKKSNNVLAIEPLTPDQVTEWLTQLEGDDEVNAPDILLIDMFLRSASAKGRAPNIFDHGTNLVGMFLTNDLLSDVPKYLVSRAFQEEQVGKQVDQFDWTLMHSELGENGHNLLRNDGLDYRKIREIAAMLDSTSSKEKLDEVQTHLLSVLNTPNVAMDATMDIAAKMLRGVKRKDHLGTAELNDDRAKPLPHTTLTISRWIRSTLLWRTGPLVTDLGASLLVGARKEVFQQKIDKQIVNACEEAVYQGVFSGSVERRWWREAIENWALSTFEGLAISAPGRFAADVAECLGLSEDDYATCAVCKEKWPETIARNVDDGNEWRQVHWHCSTSIDEISVPLGFEEIREFN